jgi:hypothetical protein
MAMNKTQYGRKIMLDHRFGRIEYPFPSGVWFALFTGDPTELGLTTNELTQLGYARKEISALFGDAVLSSGQISNAADIDFDVAGEDWPEITHGGIMTALTGGMMTDFGPAATARVVDVGDRFVIRIGQLTITER